MSHHQIASARSGVQVSIGTTESYQSLLAPSERMTFQSRVWRCESALLRLVMGLVVVALCCHSASSGCPQAGQVEGVVADHAGGRIGNATVLLRTRSGVVVQQTRSDAEGKFVFDRVAKGQYELEAQAGGFSSSTARIDVVSAAIQSITLTLSVGVLTDRVVVTATRTETSADEIGTSLTVVTNQDLVRTDQSLIAESLRVVPGLTVVQTGGRGGLTSVFTRGGESDYNKILIDGVPVNAAGGSFDFASLTPDNVDRIEVARGPRSALFGSDAMTSVIQLVTHRGTTPTPEFVFTGEGGSFDYHRESAILSGRIGWFDYSTSYGFQTTAGRFENSDFTNRSASINLGFRVTPDADLRFIARTNNDTLGVPGATAVLFADPDQRQKHRDLAVSAAFTQRLSPRWSQTARLVYSEFDTHSFDPVAQDLSDPGRPPLQFPAFGPDFAFDFREHQKRYGFQYQSTVILSPSQVITGGADYERERGVFTDEFSRVAPSRSNLGLYIQDQASLGNRLLVTAGVRGERNRAEVPDDLRQTLESLGSTVPVGEVGFGFSVNPRISASVVAHRGADARTMGGTRLKASFGTGIKEPNLTEAFSPNSFFIGNPGLDPERAYSFDIGVSQEFYGRRAVAELTYFDNRFRDLIVFTFDPTTFGPVVLPNGQVTNFVNLDRASARGTELIVMGRPWARLRVRGSYMFLVSRLDETGDAASPLLGLPLLRRPRHSGTFDVSWVDRRWDLSLEGSILGRRRDLSPLTSSELDFEGRPFFNDGFAKLNASGSFQVNRVVRAFARVENLLNRDYQEVLGFPAYRLNFSAGLRIRIGRN
jgi:vitamin B12 transporter